MAQSSEIKLLKRFDQNVEITGTLTVGGVSVSPSSYLTSVPSEYLTQTEGDARYLQSFTVPSEYLTETEGDARYLQSFDITTQTDPKYLRANASDYFTGRLSNISLNETPAYDRGAINLQPSVSGGSTGITLRSKVNDGSDAGYIWWYDDNDHYNTLNSTENGVLLIAVQNDGGATSMDSIAIESSGDIYLNPGVASEAIGSGTFNPARGNIYLGYGSSRSRILTTSDSNSFAPKSAYDVYGTGYGWLMNDYDGSANKLRMYYNDGDYTMRFYSYHGSTGDAYIGLYYNNGFYRFGGSDINNWKTAYNWGNHADAGYQSASTAITTSNIGSQSVAYAQNANNLDGLNSTAYMRDDGWNTSPGQDADTQTGMRSDFSYANNAPHTGDLIRFGSGNYSLQLSSQYGGSGQGFSFRTRNGDVGTWNPWYQLIHAGNISSQTVSNSDKWDGYQFSDYLNQAVKTNSTPSFDQVAANNGDDALGVSFRQPYEVISGEGWCTAHYAYNNNDGFLFLNRDSTGGTARPVFHIGGKNNASHAGYAADDSIVTLVRTNGVKSTGTSYSYRGLSNSSYYTNIIKTSTQTIFNDAQGSHKFNGTIDATDLRIESGAGNSIRIGDGFGSGGSATIHNYNADLYLQYNNGSQATNLYIGGGGTQADLRLDTGGGLIKMNRDGKSGDAINIDHVENSNWAFRFQTSSAGNDNASGFWVNSDGTPDMRLRRYDGTVRVLLHSNGTSYIAGGNLLVGTANNLTSQALQVNGFVDITNLDAALRFYNGSTFRGGFGDGQWATGNSSYTNDLSIIATSRFIIQTGGSNDPRVLIDSNGLARFNNGIRLPDTNGTINSLWGIYGWDSQLQFTKRNLSTDGYEGTAMFLDYGGLYAQSDYSFRAPIFYDSNSTSYYTNPAGESIMKRIRCGTSTNDNNGTVSLSLNDGSLHFRAVTDANHKMWYYDGLNFSTNPSHGHIRFWADSVQRTNATGGSYLRFDVDCQNATATVHGTFYSTGDIVAYSSDERLKTNIKPISNPIEKIKKISGVTYDWVSDIEEKGFNPRVKKDDVGVIAQEIEAILPQVTAPAPFDHEMDDEIGELVSKSGKGYKTVQYEKIVPLLIEAIKEQQKQIDELKSLINKS